MIWVLDIIKEKQKALPTDISTTASATAATTTTITIAVAATTTTTTTDITAGTTHMYTTQFLLSPTWLSVHAMSKYL